MLPAAVPPAPLFPALALLAPALHGCTITRPLPPQRRRGMLGRGSIGVQGPQGEQENHGQQRERATGEHRGPFRAFQKLKEL